MRLWSRHTQLHFASSTGAGAATKLVVGWSVRVQVDELDILYQYQELGDSSEREPSSNDCSDCCSQPRWMTWASADEDGDNGNTNENKDAETKSCVAGQAKSSDDNPIVIVQERAIRRCKALSPQKNLYIYNK